VEYVYATNECYKQQDKVAFAGSAPGNSNKKITEVTLKDEADFKGAGGYENTLLDVQTYWVAIDNDTPELKHFSTGRVADLSSAIRADISWYTDAEVKDNTYEPGTEQNPYVLSDAEDLYGFAVLVTKNNSFESKYVVLDRNITVNANTPSTLEGWQAYLANSSNALKEWTPIGNGDSFSGTFNGQGHTISGLYALGISEVGLFGQTSDKATIKNLKLKNSYFSGKDQIGSIVGYAAGIFENIYSNAVLVAEDTVTNGGRQCGGIIGRQNYTTTITKCWFAGTIDGDTYLGGIVGDINSKSSTLRNCLFSGKINSDKSNNDLRIGGLAGQFNGSNGKIYTSLSVGELNITGTHTTQYIGSVIGLPGAPTCENVYTSTEYLQTSIGSKTNDQISGVIEWSIDKYIGTAAKTNISNAFDWNNDWIVVKDQTPVLRGFESEVNGMCILLLRK
jgi:hypothetical protein